MPAVIKPGTDAALERLKKFAKPRPQRPGSFTRVNSKRRGR